MRRVAFFGLAPHDGFGCSRTVQHLDYSRLAVELEENLDLPLLVCFGDRHQNHDERLARFDLYGDLVAWLHAVKKYRCRQNGNRPIAADRCRKFREDLWVHEIGSEFVVAELPSTRLFGIGAAGSKIGGGEQ